MQSDTVEILGSAEVYLNRTEISGLTVNVAVHTEGLAAEAEPFVDICLFADNAVIEGTAVFAVENVGVIGMTFVCAADYCDINAVFAAKVCISVKSVVGSGDFPCDAFMFGFTVCDRTEIGRRKIDIFRERSVPDYLAVFGELDGGGSDSTLGLPETYCNGCIRKALIIGSAERELIVVPFAVFALGLERACPVAVSDVFAAFVIEINVNKSRPALVGNNVFKADIGKNTVCSGVGDELVGVDVESHDNGLIIVVHDGEICCGVVILIGDS
ncbi:unknown [Ruminococcus sp. CAG:382]|nr:unknown [Ruminococcus sp. CAG:382]